jgi:hypothetical protein
MRQKIHPNRDSMGGIDSLSYQTLPQGYLGDSQKGEGVIQFEAPRLLTTFIPIKLNVARTNTLIDKTVYQRCGLTDEELEFIECWQYEQALTNVKA